MYDVEAKEKSFNPVRTINRIQKHIYPNKNPMWKNFWKKPKQAEPSKPPAQKIKLDDFKTIETKKKIRDLHIYYIETDDVWCAWIEYELGEGQSIRKRWRKESLARILQCVTMSLKCN